CSVISRAFLRLAFGHRRGDHFGKLPECFVADQRNLIGAGNTLSRLAVAAGTGVLPDRLAPGQQWVLSGVFRLSASHLVTLGDRQTQNPDQESQYDRYEGRRGHDLSETENV